MDAEPARHATRYRFGPLERRGIVAGWRGGQLAVVAASLAVDVMILRAVPSPPGIAAAVVVVGAALAVATWPVAGRTAEEWAPDALRHVSRSLSRRAGRRAGPFGALALLPVELRDSGRAAGVLVDRTARRYTCVLRASSTGFVLLGEPEQAARVTAWATVLASLARQGSSVHRLQWVARSLPDAGAEVRSHLARAAVVGPEHDAHRSYLTLVQHEQAVAHVHDVLLAVSVDATRAARAVRAAGGGDPGACGVLLREAASLRRLLGDSGIDTGDVLDPVALADAVRSGFDDPSGVAVSGRRQRWPWPMGIDAGWSEVRVDGTWHATYWVAEWPRRDVGPDFLGPLLVSDVRRTLALVMEPLAPIEAARRVEQARTADIADAELRRRGGFLATARRRREEEVLVEREGELAEGHGQYRFAGYVTVSATDREALDEACARTEQAAGRAGLELRRCYGDQDRAFTCTLPLGRGLP